MDSSDTLLISGREVSRLLDIGECMEAVEAAFKAHAERRAQPPKVLGLHADHGVFHIKAGAMNLGRHYFAAKINANFPDNYAKHRLPTIQGVVVVCDGDNGRLLALIDTIQVTIIRTGAATGVAAKYLARQDSKVATICGCGNQGRISLMAILQARRLETVYVFDTDESRKVAFAKELSASFNVNIVPVNDLGDAARKSDICVTCTPSKTPFLKASDIKPGTFIAAVGADNEDKQELESTILTQCKIVVDLLEQSATLGELHHALKQGLVAREDVHAELGEIIAGKKLGRVSDDEIIVFDSTGMALQDVAAAAIVYEKALVSGASRKMDFGA